MVTAVIVVQRSRRCSGSGGRGLEGTRLHAQICLLRGDVVVEQELRHPRVVEEGGAVVDGGGREEEEGNGGAARDDDGSAPLLLIPDGWGGRGIQCCGAGLWCRRRLLPFGLDVGVVNEENWRLTGRGGRRGEHRHLRHDGRRVALEAEGVQGLSLQKRCPGLHGPVVRPPGECGAKERGEQKTRGPQS